MNPLLPTAEVSLNARVTAVATVLCDGQIHVVNDDPFIAVLPPPSPDAAPVFLHCFPFDSADTTIVEISAPIAVQVPSDPAIDSWAVRQAHALFNVYVVREETNSTETGSLLKAQSSIIATSLSVPVLGLAVDILAVTALKLSGEFRERFSPADESKLDLALDPSLENGPVMPGIQQPSSRGASHDIDPPRTMPGYL